MIYTIGYEKLDHETLARVMRATGATILDVRSKPYGRVRKGWDQKTLAERFGVSYAGDTRLGGMGKGPNPSVRVKLSAELLASGRSVILMCQEHNPADCHRHDELAVRMQMLDGLTVRHLVYNREREKDAIAFFDALELQEAIDTGADFSGDWLDL